jgi:hypothetical protein
MARTNFERLRVYKLSEQLADQIWDVVTGWNNFARHTVGNRWCDYKRNNTNN